MSEGLEAASHLAGRGTAGKARQGQEPDAHRRFSSGLGSVSEGLVPLGCMTAGGNPAVSLEMAGGDFDLSSSVNSVNTIKIIKFTGMEMRDGGIGRQQHKSQGIKRMGAIAHPLCTTRSSEASQKSHNLEFIKVTGFFPLLRNS